MRGSQVGQECRFSAGRNSTYKSFAHWYSQTEVVEPIAKSDLRLYSQHQLLCVPQQNQTQGSVEGMGRDFQHPLQQGIQVFRRQFSIQDRQQRLGFDLLRVGIRCGNRHVRGPGKSLHGRPRLGHRDGQERSSPDRDR